MRNTAKNLKHLPFLCTTPHLPPHVFLLTGLNFSPEFFPSSTSALWGDRKRDCGQSIPCCVCHFSLLTLRPVQHGNPPTGDSPSWTPPTRILPTGLHFFMNFSSVGLFHGVPVLWEQPAAEQGFTGIHRPCKPAAVWVALCCSTFSFLSASCCCAAISPLF